MYSLLQRLIATFLLFAFFVQSCTPQIKLVHAPLSKTVLTPNTNFNALQPGEAAPDSHQERETSCILAHKQPPYLDLAYAPADITAKVFTSASGDKLSFFEDHGIWQAKVVQPTDLGCTTNNTLPVVHEKSLNLLPLLQSISQRASNLQKHRIHIVDTHRGKGVFVGALGLKGGMQPEVKASSWSLYPAVAEEKEIPLSQAVTIPGIAAAVQPTIDDKTPVFAAMPSTMQPRPRKISAPSYLDEKSDSYLAQSLPEKAQLRLKSYYQRSFFQVKSWFDDDHMALPIEQAQFHLLALEKKETPENKQVKGLSATKVQAIAPPSSNLTAYQQRSSWKKRPIGLVDLFKPRTLNPEQSPHEIKKVLLVGEPGTGKTILSHKLAYLWAQGQTDRSLQTVYVLPVRALQKTNYDNNGHVKREETLATAITNICFPGINKEKEYKELRAAIELTLEQPSTLVILDGLDERHGASESILTEAQQGNHKLLLLSRPYNLDAVRQDIDLEIEHVGFNPPQIKNYIQQYYFAGQEKEADSLLKFINSNPMLKNILHVPVNAYIVCTIWRSDKDRLLQHMQRGSLFDLYDQITAYIWERYAEKINLYKEPASKLDSRSKAELFHALGCIALAALEKGEIVIKSTTVRKVLRHFPENSLVDTELLKENGLLLFQHIDSIYQFPHLTFQEYFAGRELGRRLLSDDSVAQQQTQDFLGTHQYQRQDKMALRFMAGEMSKAKGADGIRLLLRTLRNSPQEIIGMHQLGLELSCLNEYLIQNPAGLATIEEEFHCIRQLEAWLAKGIQAIQVTENDYQLFELVSDRLFSFLSSMPALAQAAQGMLPILLKAVENALEDKEWPFIHATCNTLLKLVRIFPVHAKTVLALMLRAAKHKDWHVREVACIILDELVELAPEHADKVLQTMLHATRDVAWLVREVAFTNLGSLVALVPSYAAQVFPPLLSALQAPEQRLHATTLNSVRPIEPAYYTTWPPLRPENDKGQEDAICYASINSLVTLAQTVPNYAEQVLSYLLQAARKGEDLFVHEAIITALVDLIPLAPSYEKQVLAYLLKIAKGTENTCLEKSTIDSYLTLGKNPEADAAEILDYLLQSATCHDSYVITQVAIDALVDLVPLVPTYAEKILAELVEIKNEHKKFKKHQESIRQKISNSLHYLLQENLPPAEAILRDLLQAAKNHTNVFVHHTTRVALLDLIDIYPASAKQVLACLLQTAEDTTSTTYQIAMDTLVQLVQAAPSYAEQILPSFLKSTEATVLEVREYALRSLVYLVLAAPICTAHALTALLKATEDKQLNVRHTINTALRRLGLAQLLTIYLDTTNEKLIPYLVHAAYESPLVVKHDATKTLLIYAPHGGQPNQLDLYPKHTLEALLQQVKNQVNLPNFLTASDEKSELPILQGLTKNKAALNASLQEAAQQGDLALVELLLKEAADPCNLDENGVTPLHRAIKNRHIAIIEFLINQGANVNAPDKDGDTPLHFATMQGDADIVQLLLEKGADPNKANKERLTPLHLAAEDGYLTIVQLLLAKEADPNISDQNGYSALQWAVSSSSLEAIKPSSNGEDNQLRIVQRLLENGANPNIADYQSYTALAWAAFNGHFKITQLLLDNKANPNIFAQDGLTPLHRAAKNGNLPIAKILLASMAKSQVTTQAINDLLHWASEDGQLKLVELLLNTGANPNSSTESGDIPLHIAAKNGHEQIATLLLNSHANPLSFNQDNNTPLHEASIYGHTKVVKLLLQTPIDPDITNTIGDTPLQEAARHGNVQVVDLLLKAGADPTKIGSIYHNATPLQLALQEGHTEVVQLLQTWGVKK
jgi:ankyrin repeat protein